MDWITFSKQQVEDDALPPVCMACGAPASRRISKTFHWMPDWVGFLFLAGILPGVIADYFLGKEMRVQWTFLFTADTWTTYAFAPYFYNYFQSSIAW